MATVHHEKAGQWSKQKAERLYLWILGAIFFTTLALGMIVGFLLSRYGVASGLSLAGLGCLGFYGVFKRYSRVIDKWSNERIRYLEGGRIEALVAMHLRRLPDSYHVFHNVPCAKGGDLDHIVVGPTGVFALSTKSYKGHVVRRPNGTITLNGHPLDELDEAQQLALWLATRLKSALGDQVPYVRPVLVLPLAEVSVPATENNVWIVTDTNLQEVIAPEKPKKSIGGSRIALLVEEMKRIGAK